MGKELSEKEKARRAANRILKKEQAELGPLFAEQAVRPDEQALLMQRRQGHARAVEHTHSHIGLAYQLDILHEQALRRRAAELLSPERLAEVDHHRSMCGPEYGVGIWHKELVRLGVEPEGKGLLGNFFWSRCSACKREHAPWQTECYQDGSIPFEVNWQGGPP